VRAFITLCDDQHLRTATVAPKIPALVGLGQSLGSKGQELDSTMIFSSRSLLVIDCTKVSRRANNWGSVDAPD
jgi:hypothetical protein